MTTKTATTTRLQRVKDVGWLVAIWCLLHAVRVLQMLPGPEPVYRGQCVGCGKPWKNIPRKRLHVGNAFRLGGTRTTECPSCEGIVEIEDNDCDGR